MAMARHPAASRLLQAVMQSRTVPPRVKHESGAKFAGHYFDMAMDKYASWVLDAVWESGEV